MATTLKLPYVRYVRQVQSAPGALPQFVAMMNENFKKLKDASWVQAVASPDSVAMPANAPLTFTPSDAYDAYKMSSTTAASGIETAYAGMAAYRFTIPADAISGSKYIRGLTVTLGADKFAYSGIKVAIHATNTSTPTTDWDFIRTGGYGSTLDTANEFATYDADPEVYGVLTGHVATVSTATNQAGEYTFDLSGLGNTNYSYLFVYITMFDYTDYRASRQYWVEGSGIVNGATAEVTFASDVTADASTAWNGEYIGEGRAGNWNGATWISLNDFAFTVKSYSRFSSLDKYTLGSTTLAAMFPEGGDDDDGSVIAYAETGTTGQASGTGTVGFVDDWPGEVKGYIMGRYLSIPSGVSTTQMRFSNGLFNLTSKTFSMRMNVFKAPISNPYVSGTTTYYYLSRFMRMEPVWLMEDTGSTDERGISAKKWYQDISGGDFDMACQDTLKTTISMSHVTQMVLRDCNYDSSYYFDIPASGPGIYLYLFAFSPIVYWGSIGAGTIATIDPGRYIYAK